MRVKGKGSSDNLMLLASSSGSSLIHFATEAEAILGLLIHNYAFNFSSYCWAHFMRTAVIRFLMETISCLNPSVLMLGLTQV